MDALSEKLAALSIPPGTTLDDSEASIRTEFLLAIASAESVVRAIEAIRAIRRSVNQVHTSAELESYVSEMERIRVPVAGSVVSGTAALAALDDLERMLVQFDELISESLALRDRLMAKSISMVYRPIVSFGGH